MSFRLHPVSGEFAKSNAYEHTITELDLALDYNEVYDRDIGVAILQLMQAFSDQGHSGYSASVAIQLFSRLADFQPLSPLTGEDSEWIDVGPECGRPMWQNKRAGNVFKTEDEAYQSDYYVFKDLEGFTYTNKDSRLAITEWPFTPGRQVIEP